MAISFATLCSSQQVLFLRNSVTILDWLLRVRMQFILDDPLNTLKKWSRGRMTLWSWYVFFPYDKGKMMKGAWQKVYSGTWVSEEPCMIRRRVESRLNIVLYQTDYLKYCLWYVWYDRIEYGKVRSGCRFNDVQSCPLSPRHSILPIINITHPGGRQYHWSIHVHLKVRWTDYQG